jgi:hypothetical protein
MNSQIDYEEERTHCTSVCRMPRSRRRASFDDHRMVDVAADGSVVGVEFIDVSGGVDTSGLDAIRAEVENLIAKSKLAIKLLA